MEARVSKSLTKLLASNKKRPDRLPQSRIVASAEGDETTIYIYDAIVADEDTAYWWGGVAAETLVPEIRSIKGGTVRLRINSPGGDVFAAQSICQAIRDTGAKVIAHIDGYAASAATVIATAADEVEIAAGGFYMIHNAWTWAMGNANDLTATATLLSKIDGSLAAQYAKKSGMDVDDVRAAMDAETWYTAEEAVAAGLVDRIASGKKAEASWNMSAYAKAPKIEPKEPDQVDPAATEEHRARQQQRIRMLACLPIS
jgi:ATP-dependent protease ClpP protease subunit